MLVNAAVIPVIRQEIQLLGNWIKDCPAPGMTVNIYLSIDDKWRESEKSELLKIHAKSHIKGCSLQFIDCEIEASQSFYEKDKSIEKFDINKYPFGKKSGPNIQFFTTLRKIALKQPDLSGVILLETDAHPIIDNWISELNQRVQWLGDHVYIAGSKPVMAKTIGPIKNHLNGNAIYNLGNTDFFDFLTFWEKILIESIKINPDLAYDVALEWSYHMSKVSALFSSILHLWDNSKASKYRNGCIDISSYISNISGCSDLMHIRKHIEDHLKHNPQTIIIHGKYQNETGDDIVLNFKRPQLAS